MQETLFLLEIIGSITFMISGALEAIKHRMDLSGVYVLAFCTGVGGGTIRDLILGLPVFWTQHNWTIYLTLFIGTAIFAFYKFLEKKQSERLLRCFLIFDAFGIVSFTITGVAKSLPLHESAVVAVMMGALTCVGGGLIRDMLCGEIPLVLQTQLYATPSIVGGLMYVWLLPLGQVWAVVGCGVIVLFLRLMGIYRDWHLPYSASVAVSKK